MSNISELSSIEKTVTLYIEKSANHVRLKEKNFFLGRQDLSPEIESEVKPANKAKITSFSWRSQRNCKFMFDSAIRDLSTCITLTYPIELRDQLDGRQIKKHFKAFILAYLRRFGLKGRFIWVLEFQKNGNPHFHLVTDCKEDIKTQREFVASRWYKIVKSGLEKHFKAGTSCEFVKSQAGVAAYMASYLQKADQKTVPDNFSNVGRFWGGSRHAFEVEREYRLYEDSMIGVAAARRTVRMFRKYKSSKLRYVSSQNGVRYKLPKSGGGFVCWSGRSAFDQLMEFQEKQEGVPF